MIHKFKMFKKNIVLDVNSGGVFVVDDLTYNMLDLIKLPMAEECTIELFQQLKQFDKSEVSQTYSQLYELYKKKILFSEEVDVSKFEHLLENSKIKAMCLHVAHDCNLRCAYCFASTGNFGGARELMTIETAKAAINFLIANSGSRKNLEVDFFGGEPLMNFDVVKQTVSYARELESKSGKNFRFTITTNGTLLDDEKINYINQEMSNVVLSLDGRKQINDRVRKMAKGNSSCYDAAMPKFIELVRRRNKSGPRSDYYIRGTFTNMNLNFVEDVLHFYDCGFDQISIEPVVSPSSAPYAIRPEHLPTIFEQYEILAKRIVELKQNGSKINFFHFMIDLEQGPCIVKRFRGCGCGAEYVAVAPGGAIFPCHQFVGNDSFKMGNVLESNEIDYKIKSQFAKSNLAHKNDCLKCWAKFYCSGGCNANNFNFEGKLLKPYGISCEMEKKRVECAIAIKAALI